MQKFNKTMINKEIIVKKTYYKVQDVLDRAKREWRKAIKENTSNRMDCGRNHYIYIKGRIVNDLVVLRPFERNNEIEVMARKCDDQEWKDYFYKYICVN